MASSPSKLLRGHELKDLLKLLSHKPLDSTASYITEEALLSGLKQQSDAANERSMMRLEKQAQRAYLCGFWIQEVVCIWI